MLTNRPESKLEAGASLKPKLNFFISGPSTASNARTPRTGASWNASRSTPTAPQTWTTGFASRPSCGRRRSPATASTPPHITSDAKKSRKANRQNSAASYNLNFRLFCCLDHLLICFWTMQVAAVTFFTSNCFPDFVFFVEKKPHFEKLAEKTKIWMWYIYNCYRPRAKLYESK